LPGVAFEAGVREVGLGAPPRDPEGYRQLGLRLAHCDPVVTFLR
jgi:hypothetical protein